MSARGNVSVADTDGNERELESVRNVGQKTFFRRDKQWRDSSVTPEQQSKAIRVTQFSPEYFELASKRQNRTVNLTSCTTVHSSGWC